LHIVYFIHWRISVAVYTTLSESQVNEMLSRFSLPPLQYMTGASDGIENTTYFLTLSDQRSFVLTLFEMLDAEQLPPYMDLMRHYNFHGLPVPSPLLDTNGVALQKLAHKPAVLFPRATGKHTAHPSVEQCVSLGKALAHLHLASADFSVHIPNPCGLAWAEHTACRVMPHLEDSDCTLLSRQLALGRLLQSQPLPRGIIHGDLFKDNVLFEGSHITAIIDFYNAGTDFFLLDLAIAVNDWCFDDATHPSAEHQSALLDAYQSVRPLSAQENLAWQDCLAWAACRFWLSRLMARLRSSNTVAQRLKDPAQYKNLLLFHASPPRK